MKKLFVIGLAVVGLSACKGNASDKVADKTQVVAEGEAKMPAVLAEDAPKFKFDNEIYDFKVIQEGEKVQTSFKFKNVGKTPLIISDATATCGCTIPEYPKEPIKPGEEGEIKVVFNSQGKIGMQDKVVSLISNASTEAVKLHLVGEVKEKK